ncbi:MULTISPECIES: LysE/ArgO family amino acid transporter [unclassified Rhodococcus (in: high G+C Gram-positive bacteria)]|uniref:LysE/ArgO family amino acid transporter n=1 Tax=unclassified Rhodococcus (in: high G+C Gram-positive bacteria) TaxID=192944 RepID=UPI00163B12EA|nr:MULTISPECIES: LysE/ArgO family amino acid transporter [unclassified Rhodococcus (in: high G+C Gram-positive bacteria)]MBC2640998.1 amino acid transporter [Rhodococcus sp. 3A]MBC2894257.1 amino acid transporter [Rhodococcus sp. 4CII]
MHLTPALLTAAAGFGTGLSLIVAIGAQNAFVLRQGIVRRHVLPVVALCAVSDAVLIAVGISGIGAVLEHAPAAITVIRWAGAAFLVSYAALAARRALRPGALDATQDLGSATLATSVLTCLALTWLNPHVYLDTVLMLGSVANNQGESGRWLFGFGAATASVFWFVALGYGAQFLRRVFARPAAWRVLDGGIAALMLTLGITLVAG